jgi:hypothetical protein
MWCGETCATVASLVIIQRGEAINIVKRFLHYRSERPSGYKPLKISEEAVEDKMDFRSITKLGEMRMGELAEHSHRMV